MKTLAKNLSILLALSLGTVTTGCATDLPDVEDPDGNGGGGGGGDGGDGPGQQPLDLSGRYQISSKFDLATNAPGKVGQVVNAILDATDDPDDPTAWIIDQVAAAMPNGTLKSLLVNAKPFVAGYLNDRLLDLAPDFVSTMVQLGSDFGQIARNVGLDATLDVSGAGASYTATHTVLGARFKIDNVESTHAFATFNVPNIVAADVGVTLDATNNVAIAQHALPVSYGKVLRIGLDAAIIPMLEPGATSLNQLLAAKVDCTAVGAAIAGAIGFGGASTFAGACTSGLDAGANFIYGKIAEIDASVLELGVTGAAKAIDQNSDRSIDKLQTGAWTGTATYAGTPAPLAGATFHGARM